MSLFLVFALEGVWHGASLHWLVRDGRGCCYIALGAVIGLAVLREPPTWAWTRNALTWYIGIVCLLVLVSQVTPTPLLGSDSDATYYGNVVTSLSSRRAQIETDPFALFLACAMLSGYVAGLPLARWLSGPRLAVLAFSVIGILFLSYSRNTLIGLFTALACGLIYRTTVPVVHRWLHLMSRLVVAACLLVPVGVLAAGTGLLHSQIQTFEQRVVDGLNGSALSADDSVQWRLTEDRLALASFDDHPVLGAGLGVFYRPHVVGEPFTNAGGRLYVHDYWIWLLVVGGVAYFGIVLLLYGGACVRLLFVRGMHPWAPVLGAGLAGVLTTSVVAPWPESPEITGLLGALIAGAWLRTRSSFI
jgi:hypothetical protein